MKFNQAEVTSMKHTTGRSCHTCRNKIQKIRSKCEKIWQRDASYCFWTPRDGGILGQKCSDSRILIFKALSPRPAFCPASPFPFSQNRFEASASVWSGFHLFARVYTITRLCQTKWFFENASKAIFPRVVWGLPFPYVYLTIYWDILLQRGLQ